MGKAGSLLPPALLPLPRIKAICFCLILVHIAFKTSTQGQSSKAWGAGADQETKPATVIPSNDFVKDVSSLLGRKKIRNS